jgi:hypothetical protein
MLRLITAIAAGLLPTIFAIKSLLPLTAPKTNVEDEFAIDTITAT